MTGIAELQSRAVGAKLRVERREADWVFHLAADAAICVGCLWRLRDPNRLLLTNNDDAQQFGLPSPLNAAAEFNRLVGEATIVGLEADSTAGDLRIAMSDKLTLEILSDSSGYESWQAWLGTSGIIGRGDGLSSASLP